MTPLALVLFLAQPFDAFAAGQRPIPPDGTTRVVGTVTFTGVLFAVNGSPRSTRGPPGGDLPLPPREPPGASSTTCSQSDSMDCR